MKAIIKIKGGSGSGFHGHAGRPGLVGGSISHGVTITDIEPVSNKPSGKVLSIIETNIVNDTIANVHKMVSMSNPEAIVVGQRIGKGESFGRCTRINGKYYVFISPWEIDRPAIFDRKEWFGISDDSNASILEHVVAHEYGHLWWKQQSVKSADLVGVPGKGRARVETNPILLKWEKEVWKQHRGKMSGYARYVGSYHEGFADSFANFVNGDDMDSEVEQWFVENVT